MGDTPLGYVVQIRAETDKKRIGQMTQQEKKIRREWRQFKTKQAMANHQAQQITMTVEQFQNAMRNLAGR